MKAQTSIIDQALVEQAAVINSLIRMRGKRVGTHRTAQIELLTSIHLEGNNNFKKLREFLELALEEIDKRKVLRGI